MTATDTRDGATSLMVALRLPPLRLAVTVADSLEGMVPLCALKLAVVAAAATVTDAGTLRFVLLLES